MDNIEQRLENLGIVLPTPALPAANYVPTAIVNGLLYISGQLPMEPSGLAYKGKVGVDVSIDDAKAAAKLCAINILAQTRAALEGFGKVARCVKLGGFVNCGPDFDQHPAVINGASDFMVEVFGDAGRHTRFAVGAPSLPFDAAVEVEAIFALR